MKVSSRLVRGFAGLRRRGASTRVLGPCGAGELGICHLELGERLPDGTHLLGVEVFEDGQQGPHALDREPRLLEVAAFSLQAVVAERGDGVDGLQQEIRDLELRELGLDLLEQALLVVSH